MTDLQYRVDGLDCPNCAAKLERALKNMDSIHDASIDLMQGCIYLRAEADSPDLLAQIQKTADNTERGLHIYESEAPEATLNGPGTAHGHSHEHDHDHEHDDHEGGHSHDHSHASTKKDRWLLAAAMLSFIAGLFVPENIRFLFFIASWLLAGWEVILSALITLKNFFVSIFKRPLVNPLDENLLMTIATIGACILGEFAEGAMVMLLFNLGEQLQGMAVNKSKASIAKLMEVRPDHANLITESGVQTVSPQQVHVGQLIELRPGERVPLDSIVVTGTSSLDTRDMTGESVPRDVGEGDELLSGTINLSGLLTARVVRESSQSAVTRALERIRDSSKGKAQTEKFFTRFARVYTPIVVSAAFLLAVIPPLFVGQWDVWIYRALSFLVISCPCALVLSIPLSFFSGIGAASKKGLLCKGGIALEQLSKVDAVAFDKTGTLTLGKLQVESILPADGVSRELLIETAATAESASTHPIAKIISGLAQPLAFDQMEEIPGHGVKCEIEGQTALVGNEKLLQKYGIASPALEGTGVLVARNGQYLGTILLSDTLHPQARETIDGLKQRGIKTIAMLSGDNQRIAESIGGALGGIQVQAELLPDQKVEALRKLPGQTIAFVGDGVNDAPCLLEADIGVAIGLSGSDSAIEAADIVLLQGSPKGLISAIDLAKATMRNVRQNAGFALIVKAVFLVLAAFGLAGMWMAVFADAGVTVLCVLNALRLLKD